MIKRIIFLLAFILISVSAQSQIQQQIDFDTTLIKKSPVDPDWLYTGTFYFEQLPEPLTPTKISFTLTALRDDDPNAEIIDWVIKVFHYDNMVAVIGDESFMWPGPHKKGDIFAGTFEVIPLRSGSCKIALSSGIFFPESIAFKKEPSIHWCFDEDGNLQYLGQYKLKPNGCDPAPCYFFNKDSVIIKQHPISKKREVFGYDIIIKPTPSIGDTSLVIFHLNSNYDIPANFDIVMEARCFDLINIPNKPDYHIFKGQVLDIPIIVVPNEINSGHKIVLTFTNFPFSERKGSNTQSIGLGLIFDDNGKLKYISNEGLFRIPQSKYPQSFSTMDFKRDFKRIKLNGSE